MPVGCNRPCHPIPRSLRTWYLDIAGSWWYIVIPMVGPTKQRLTKMLAIGQGDLFSHKIRNVPIGVWLRPWNLLLFRRQFEGKQARRVSKRLGYAKQWHTENELDQSRQRVMSAAWVQRSILQLVFLKPSQVWTVQSNYLANAFYMAVTCRRIVAIKHLQWSFSVGVDTNQIRTGMEWSFDPNHSIFEPKQVRRGVISFVSASLCSETNLLHQQLAMFSSLQLWQLWLQLLTRCGVAVLDVTGHVPCSGSRGMLDLDDWEVVSCCKFFPRNSRTNVFICLTIKYESNMSTALLHLLWISVLELLKPRFQKESSTQSFFKGLAHEPCRYGSDQLQGSPWSTCGGSTRSKIEYTVYYSCRIVAPFPNKSLEWQGPPKKTMSLQ